MIIGDYFINRNKCGVAVNDCLFAMHTEVVKRIGFYNNLPNAERHEVECVTRLLVSALGTDVAYKGNKKCKLYNLCNTIYDDAQAHDIVNSERHAPLWAVTEKFHKTLK